MENHGLAIEDAGVALELDKMFAKGYYRRAASFMAMGKYKKARCCSRERPSNPNCSYTYRYNCSITAGVVVEGGP